MQADPTAVLVVGTYTVDLPHVKGTGAGLHVLALDAQGALSTLHVQGGLENPSYVALSADQRLVYSVREVGAALSPGMDVFAVGEDLSLRQVGHYAYPGDWPCHVAVTLDPPLALLSNYLSGETLAVPLGADGLPSADATVLVRAGSGPNSARQEAPHAHCARVSPDGRYVYAADLGVDAVLGYALVDGLPVAEPDITLPAVPGAGPRHVDFTPSGRFMLANAELSSSLALYDLASTPPRRLCEVSTLPLDFAGESGAGGMAVHPSGRFVYVGNRGHDSIFAAAIDEARGALAPLGTWPLGGRTPRDLAVSPDGRFLVAASQDDAFLRVWSIDQDTGALTEVGQPYAVETPVCVKFFQGSAI